MANLEHLKLVTGDIEKLITWRVQASYRTCLDLSHLVLPELPLRGKLDSFLKERRLPPYECERLRKIVKGVFIDADFTGTDLVRADFTSMNLAGAKLNDSLLADARFVETRLSNVDFSGSTFGSTTISNCDLSSAVNLQAIHHSAPSFVDTTTLFRSWPLPDEFLRGVGIPEELISHLPILRSNAPPIQFYSCFISYSHKDEEFCKRIHSRMQQEKLRVWYAPEDMPGGKKIHESIDQAIRAHEKLLLILSPHSMASAWVEQEIYNAMERERQENRRVLFPIRLADYDEIVDWKLPPFHGKDMAREIREYFIPDFSNWKDHDSFEAAFGRLLRDLKNEDLPSK